MEPHGLTIGEFYICTEHNGINETSTFLSELEFYNDDYSFNYDFGNELFIYSNIDSEQFVNFNSGNHLSKIRRIGDVVWMDRETEEV
jgi:hypothetical protein